MCTLEKLNFKISRGSMPPDPTSLLAPSAFDTRDLTQLGRERRRRRLLKFELPVFTFLVCIAHSFLFNFA